MINKTSNYQVVNVMKISNSVSRKNAKSSILIIYTGGTIGMEHGISKSLVAADFSQIIKRLPSLQLLDIYLDVISLLSPLDSSNVSISEWQDIGQIIFDNHHYDGFVILHGTDTMSFTASALSYMLQGLNKPVIFTGAQLPIFAIRSDARPNLVTAIEIASAKKDGKPIVPEVCIYFNYQLLRSNRTFKKRSSQFAAFGCENYPILAKAGVSIDYNHSVIMKYNQKEALNFKNQFCPDVLILKLFPSLKESFIRHLLSTPDLKGIVLETYGSGNGPTSPWFLNCLKNAISKEVVIYNVSQLIGGIVMHGRYETSKYFEEIGVISGSDITREAAITKLMFLLGSESNIDNVKQKLITSLCGELTILK